MKKFILLCVAVIGLLATSCTSCTNDSFGIEYSLQSNGDADGNVNVLFDGGNFNINGAADYQFSWANNLVLCDAVYTLDEARYSNDPKVSQAADYINEWLDNTIKVSAASGTYDIYIKGYVKETLTQITVTVDRHFTNRQDSVPLQIQEQL